MKVARYGAVFDLDGVIIRSGPLHDAAWNRTVSNRRGSPGPTVDFLRQIASRSISTAAIARSLFPEVAADQTEIDKICAEKNRLYDELLRRELKVAPEKLMVPGVKDLVGQLADQSVSLALNTSSPASEAERILNAFGMLGYFSLVLTAENIINHKPHPEGYLLAAERLGLAPRQCVGFEDSLPGLQSLNSAGYRVVVAVGSILTEAQVRASCPWIARYIPDFTNFTPREASRLLTPGQV